MSPLRRRAETWFPSILGTVVAGSTIVLVAADEDHSIPAAIGEGALALVLSLGVAAVGYRYYARSDLPEAHAGTVARWTVAATGLVAALVGWFGILQAVVGEVAPPFAAITAIAVGMLGGTTTGILSARVQKRQADRRQALEEYAALFESATVGIFVHDPEDGRIRDVNPRGAETIIEWADDIEAIIHVSTVLETLTGEAETDLQPVEIAPALRTELDRIESTYPEVTVETRVPDGTRVLANDLLGEVLGNVLTNAVDHNDPADLHLEVSAAGPDGDRVVVRIADDGSGVPDDQKEAIFGRSETGAGPSTGSGFGLFFVDAMLAEYGGDVTVEDNDRGGATFVLEFRAADAG